MESTGKRRFLKLFGIYAVAILVGLLIAILFDGPKVYATVFYLIIMLGLYLYIKTENIHWKSYFTHFDRRGLSAVIISAVIIAIVIALTILLRTAVWEEGITEEFDFDIFVFIGSCLLAPITEEFLCRGILLNLLREKHGDIFSVIVSAVIFYLIHGNYMNVGSLIFGLLAGWIMIKSRNILPGVAIHLSWNLVIYFLPLIAMIFANIQI